MIDRVAIIWANGTASVDWPLTDELHKLEHVAALTAVFGPSHDKLAKFTAVQDVSGDWYRVFEIDKHGVASYTCKFDTVVSDLLAYVDREFGDDAPDRSGFHKEDQ